MLLLSFINFTFENFAFSSFQDQIVACRSFKFGVTCSAHFTEASSLVLLVFTPLLQKYSVVLNKYVSQVLFEFSVTINRDIYFAKL